MAETETPTVVRVVNFWSRSKWPTYTLKPGETVLEAKARGGSDFIGSWYELTLTLLSPMDVS